ncbi:sigma-70 family RNA polymerase sigma factor [Thalassococcus sp. CAU 1522]|uniref:Sigma-70 family RNA polymerase sigma factor n=1 Tax=Thalassococcus arenae TaxID=2851652 RepID=A0ABS6NB95_9RHOB|nr:sigma-70 family RNA polymerase sigma factor [Thalassococcus arenae]MBV2361296.1 sigma-70 family RNA polymerase sigma factor [Thalassococcus arenae]
MSPQDEIEGLIARVAMGNREAFRRLYGRTSAKLFGICLRVLNDKELAEEALQEVYVTIWRKAGMYREGVASPMTWLITLARNAAVDRRRRIGGLPLDGDGQAIERLRDPAPGPEAQAVARSEARALQACLDTLNPDHAAMIRSVYLDGATYAEMAAAHGAKLNTVRTWLRRSLMQLRECLSR